MIALRLTLIWFVVILGIFACLLYGLLACDANFIRGLIANYQSPLLNAFCRLSCCWNLHAMQPASAAQILRDAGHG